MRKISRRSFLKASAVVAGAAALAACGGSDSSSTAASTATSSAASGSSESGATNLVWTIWDKESTAYWQVMADGYMASHSNVTIEMLDLGSTDYMTVLATQLAGAADIDVLSIKDIPGYANLINLDYLTPMNDVLTRDTADFSGTIEQLTTDDGNFYAVPFRNDFWVLFYNKDLFDAAGVPYPANDLTMEEYDALARQMTSGEGDAKVYGTHYHTWRSCVSLFSILDGENTIVDGNYLHEAHLRPGAGPAERRHLHGLRLSEDLFAALLGRFREPAVRHAADGQLVHRHPADLHGRG